MANMLGRVVRYINEGVSYGLATKRSDPMQGVLRAMSDRSKVGSTNETMDVDAVLRLAVTSTWVYSAIKLIADRVASGEARPHVMRKVDDEQQRVRNHPFQTLMEQPNSLMTSDFIFAYITIWTYLSGNGYLFISTPGPGVGLPEELWPLPSNMVKPKPDTLRTSKLTGGQCIDYSYKIGTTEITLPGENVIHLRLPNPFDYWNGLSPLTAMLLALRTDQAQGQYVFSHYSEDNAVPPAIISLPAETSPVDFEIAAQMIREQFAGKHRTAITRAGDLTVQVVQQTMDQLQHNEIRTFNQKQIHMAYGIPDGMVSGAQSGDGRLATEIAFTRNTVQPFLDRMASEMTSNLAPYYGKDIIIKAPSIIPQDRALAIQEYTTYAADRTINENRKVLNLPAFDMDAVVQTINDSRAEQGLDPVELADGVVQLLAQVPTRLFPFVSSATFKNPMAPAFANVPNQPGVGDLPGMFGPDNYTSDQAVRAMGLATELRRWERVATREATRGRNPAERTFATTALPDMLLTRIRQRIDGQPADAIKTIFTEEIQAITKGAPYEIRAAATSEHHLTPS